jgi:hypothetical protein
VIVCVCVVSACMYLVLVFVPACVFNDCVCLCVNVFVCLCPVCVCVLLDLSGWILCCGLECMLIDCVRVSVLCCACLHMCLCVYVLCT